MTESSGEAIDVQSIKPLSPAECTRFALAELQAFLALIDELGPGDWEQPTACTLWNVRDVVAHQAGHVQMGSGLRGFVAQVNPIANRKYRQPGMAINDALNQRQVETRRGLAPEAVMAELRDGTPRSIRSRERLSWPVERIRVPVPPAGLMPLGHLLRHIFPRDMWIHRLDIADATGKPFEVAPEHDGVMLAQVVADAARQLRKREPATACLLHLRGPAGGTWVLNSGPRPVELEMDALDFMRRSSGRVSVDEALSRVSGSAPLEMTKRMLEGLEAPY